MGRQFELTDKIIQMWIDARKWLQQDFKEGFYLLVALPRVEEVSWMLKKQ